MAEIQAERGSGMDSNAVLEIALTKVVRSRGGLRQSREAFGEVPLSKASPVLSEPVGNG